MSPQESSGERTERATPKKRKDARKRGQVLKSTEVNTAFCTMVIFGFMLIFLTTYLQEMMKMMQNILGPNLNAFLDNGFNTQLMQIVFSNVLIAFAGILLPILLCALLAGLLINIVQVGFLFTTKPLEPKLERISPVKGLKRIFSARTLSELFKSIIKVTVLGIILYRDYTSLIRQLPSLMQTDLYTSFVEILSIAFRLALKMGLALVAIALADYLFQWWSFEKELRMTKQEVKDEYKLTEGDPMVKQRIKQKQREMSAQRMMAAIPQADVVITNPTHYAIALRYEEGKSSAPMVIAKGQDFLARKIKEIAAENNVTMIENRPLARSLYMFCEVGMEIPPEFYQAVADILVYVYRQKNKLRGGRR